jgi:hypothetical protein
MGVPETQLLSLLFILGAMVGTWAVVYWIQGVSVTPDPWGPELDLAIQNDELPPSCVHCSATYSETDHFCPGCGAAVGDYNNCNPYLYVFSLGEVLRLGTSGRFRVNWLTVGGFLLLSTEYACFAPVYCIFFFLNLGGSPAKPVDEPPPLATETG